MKSADFFLWVIIWNALQTKLSEKLMSWQMHMSAEFYIIWLKSQHVPDMSTTFPTKFLHKTISNCWIFVSRTYTDNFLDNFLQILWRYYDIILCKKTVHNSDIQWLVLTSIEAGSKSFIGLPGIFVRNQQCFSACTAHQ